MKPVGVWEADSSGSTPGSGPRSPASTSTPNAVPTPSGRVIGFDWSGDMTHDGAAAYDRFLMARHQQCVFHVLHRPRPGASPGRPGQGVSASGHHPVPGGGAGGARPVPGGEYSTRPGCKRRDRYVEGPLFALSERPRVNAANERLAKHLYHYGEQWLTFLEDPSIPATNHRAERALKTPIVNRKVWGGNRTEAGARRSACCNRPWPRANSKPSRSWNSCATVSAAYWASCSSRQRRNQGANQARSAG